ncbi:hypothetical protein ABID23_001419 [Bartonella silvatica]|uniref:Uncharacterized protein n=1 Tax=Bartonella silvatica TaxID=357760 RepID=A0ABV2HIM1_9HYPH
MKKISVSIAKNRSAYRLSDKRFLMKALFWIMAVVPLLHVSPSFAENVTSKEMLLASVERVGVADPKSDIAADGGDKNAIGVLRAFQRKII